VTFTDEQLWAAVRSAGRDGQSFTCASVRECLGMSSKKRHELAQFRDRFRAFRLTAGEGIEKIGKTAYRLTAAHELEHVLEHELEHEAVETLIEFEVIAIADDAAEPIEASVPEAALPVEKVRPMLEHPAAIEESDLGFGEPMVAGAADSGELAANHVIFSAWPESMQPAAASSPAGPAAHAQSPQQTEAQIEAEVRDLVSGSEASQPTAPESLLSQAEQAVARTWRDRGHWLGRRFAELFNRTQN
jgi:hypothetical protein